jgi:hypothetical protein
MAALLLSLSLTSLLLLMLSPGPLPSSLHVSVEQPLTADAFKVVYQTHTPIDGGRWRSIFIHHSRTRRGDLASLLKMGLADHFVIGNGERCGDGEIQWAQRWMDQHAARLGSQTLPADQISICLVGDFDQSAPTPAQLQRVGELVRSLQKQLRIPAERVAAYSNPRSVHGIGREFPAATLARQLVR